MITPNQAVKQGRSETLLKRISDAEAYIDKKLAAACADYIPEKVEIDVPSANSNIPWKEIRNEIIERYRRAGWKVRFGNHGQWFKVTDVPWDMVFYPKKSRFEPVWPRKDPDDDGPKEHEEV
jgi:hypothetical protein